MIEWAGPASSPSRRYPITRSSIECEALGWQSWQRPPRAVGEVAQHAPGLVHERDLVVGVDEEDAVRHGVEDRLEPREIGARAPRARRSPRRAPRRAAGSARRRARGRTTTTAVRDGEEGERDERPDPARRAGEARAEVGRVERDEQRAVHGRRAVAGAARRPVRGSASVDDEPVSVQRRSAAAEPVGASPAVNRTGPSAPASAAPATRLRARGPRRGWRPSARAGAPPSPP